MDWKILISKPEGERLEKKRDGSGADFLKKVASTLCAFANNIHESKEDAYLLVGVDDNSAISGFRDTDEKVAGQIRNAIADAITPRINAEIQKWQDEKGEVIVVRVSATAPYVYQYLKTVYIRIGASTQRATNPDIGLLTHQKKGGAEDSFPLVNSPVSEIDPTFFAGYQRATVDEDNLRENHRPYEEQLAHHGFYDYQYACPTMAGILMCGANPQKHYPDSVVDYQRFSGVELARDEMINRQMLKGNLMQQWQALELLLPTMIETWYESSASNFSSLRENEGQSYSLLALRELLINAIIHRDYRLFSPVRIRQFNNRIEIISPGGLVPPAQPDNFPNRSQRRNSSLMAAFQRLRWVENAGTGVTFAKRMLEKNGNPPPRFEFDDYSVAVTVMAKRHLHAAFTQSR